MNLKHYDILNALYEGIYIVDLNRKIIFWNKAAEKITGFSAKEVVGSHCYDNILIHVDNSGNNLCKSACPLSDSIKNKNTNEAQVYLHHKKGHRIPVTVKVMPFKNKNGTVIGGIEFFEVTSGQNIKEIKYKELKELAFLDPLTKVANRNYLNLELTSKFSEFHRFNTPFGLLFFDIDHFKKFNDSYGHATGDIVLQTVANTIKANIRPFDIVGRWGGEEFISIIHNVKTEEIKKFGERFRFLIEKSTIKFENSYLSVTASIGGTIVKKTDNSVSLLARADKLMYLSKEKGRNQFNIG